MTAEPAKVIYVTDMPEKTEKSTGEIAVFVSQKIQVVDNETMQLADEAVKKADKRLELIEKEFGSFRDAAHKAHKGWTTLINKLNNPVKEYKEYHINQVKAYQTKVKQAIEAEERRLQEIARQEEEERRLLEAEEAEEEGNFEEAQAIIEEPVYVAPVKVQNNIPKIDGRKYTVRPKAKVVNKFMVIRAVAGNPALIDLLDINIAVANAKARAFGRELGRVVPGLEYYEE